MRTRDGFSLIEALVALAIASVCLLALFGLQRQLVSSQRRYEAAVARAQAQRNILALVRELNPEAQPQGSTALPDGERLTWTSRPVSPLRQALTQGGSAGPYLVRVSAVEATLTDAAGAVKGRVSVERLGWRPAPRSSQAGGSQAGSGPSTGAGAAAGAPPTFSP